MFFTYCARIAAMLLSMLGAWNVAVGFGVVVTSVGPHEVAELTPYSMTGQLIGNGIYAIAFAVALGTLGEISLTLRKRTA
jgi:hypothetical protein